MAGTLTDIFAWSLKIWKSTRYSIDVLVRVLFNFPGIWLHPKQREVRMLQKKKKNTSPTNNNHSLTLICFFAAPICVLCTCRQSVLILEARSLRARLTFVANFKLVKVSLRCACSGLIMTNISVFELPPREYCNKYVSFSRQRSVQNIS